MQTISPIHNHGRVCSITVAKWAMPQRRGYHPFQVKDNGHRPRYHQEQLRGVLFKQALHLGYSTTFLPLLSNLHFWKPMFQPLVMCNLVTAPFFLPVSPWEAPTADVKELTSSELLHAPAVFRPLERWGVRLHMGLDVSNWVWSLPVLIGIRFLVMVWFCRCWCFFVVSWFLGSLAGILLSYIFFSFFSFVCF